jgi:DNA replication protein DnaC
VQVLILDDWSLAVLTPAERRDLLEILDDRHGRASTIVTSQVPVDTWHDLIGDAKMTTALLDRLTHRCHILETGNDNFRFKASSDQAARKMKEASHALTLVV